MAATSKPRRDRDPADIDDLAGLRAAAADCTRCGLYRDATRTVCGAGPAGASAMFVGEQPGDREDLAGEPFVGPAGKLLDRALRDAGIPRDEVYLTNAVKHFKFEQRGKRRIHQRPSVDEIRACRPWLDAELRLVRPNVLVTLGATAARALLGASFRVTRHRGEVLDWEDGLPLVPTVHPSSVLRTPGDGRSEAFDALVADLESVAGALRRHAPS
ncbi:UdgX family uracil-DNA binding protein [Pseudonocardia acaciae]|uniref:UdgX family uracil-DNA binding protein n=1 Tax=Pseudonocardia acaciae TaxID=551276 RepID=UPI00056C9A26|nr:UdgX family uracil-DNA binding protein [Pseudonocardia acaciae]